MKIDLTAEQQDLVRSILIKHLLKNTTVFVFGSRAKGNARKYSDLDLAIDYQGKELSSSIMVELTFDFEHSLLPFKVDVLDLNSITDSFKRNIENDLVELIVS